MKKIIQSLLIPGIIVLTGTYVLAQAPQKKDIRLFHFRWENEQNGKKRIIDTTLEIGPDFDKEAFLRSLQLDPDKILPRVEDEKGKQPMVKNDHIDVTDNSSEAIVRISCDSLKKKIMVMDRELNNASVEIMKLSMIPDSVFLNDSSLKQLLIIDSHHLPGAKEMRIIEEVDSNVKKIMLTRKIMIIKLDKGEKAPGKELRSDEKLKIEQLDMYPNPATGKFILSLDVSQPGDIEIRITDASGKTVLTEQLSGFTGPYTREIDLSGEAKGLFFIRVKQGNNSITRKIIIQ